MLLRQDRLYGYAVNVVPREEPVIDGQHEIKHMNGDTKTRQVWDVVFSDPASGHVLIVGFDRESRDKLVEQLTGGIVLADAVPR